MRDPDYLSDLGELATLKNFLITAYFQSVWEYFDSDEEVWQDYVLRASSDELQLLVNQMEIVASRPPTAILEIVGVTGIDTTGEAVTWLNKCLEWFRVHTKHSQNTRE